MKKKGGGGGGRRKNKKNAFPGKYKTKQNQTKKVGGFLLFVVVVWFGCWFWFCFVTDTDLQKQKEPDVIFGHQIYLSEVTEKLRRFKMVMIDGGGVIARFQF